MTAVKPWFALFASLPLVPTLTYAQAQNDPALAACRRGEPDARIEACNKLLNAAGKQSSETTFVIYNNLCDAFRRKGAYAAAIEACDKAVGLDARSPTPHYFRGMALGQQGQSDKAMEAYAQALVLNPKHASSLFERGLLHYNARRYAEALADFTAAVEAAPRWASAHYNVGLSTAALGQTAQALEAYNEAIRLDPKYANALNARGQLHFNARRYTEALADYAAAIATNPKWAIPQYNAGQAFGALNQTEKAIEAYSEAIRLDPKYWAALNARGLLHMNARRSTEALADFNAAVEASPNWATPRYNIGQLYAGQNQIDKAMEAYSEAIRLSPRYADPLNARGQIHLNARRYAEAIEDFTAAIAANARWSTPYNGRGRAYADTDQVEKALADYNEAIRLDSKYFNALSNRAALLARLGDQGAAFLDFERLLSLQPQNSFAQLGRDNARSLLQARGVSVPEIPQDWTSAPPVQIRQAALSNATGKAASFAPESRVALVIGNSAYKFATPLPNPRNDAGDLAATLRELGYTVIEGSDLDWRGTVEKVREFSARLDKADVALFFYAGHGVQVNGRNYLIPIDAKLERAGDLDLDAVDMQTILRPMEAAKRVNLVFLDACRDNPFTRSLARSLGATRSGSTSQGLAQINSAAGTMIAFSTQPDNVAQDGEGRNSPFTSALLKHIRTPNLEVEQMMKLVRTEVMAATKERQVPWGHSSLVGNVFLYPVN